MMSLLSFLNITNQYLFLVFNKQSLYKYPSADEFKFH